MCKHKFVCAVNLFQQRPVKVLFVEEIYTVSAFEPCALYAREAVVPSQKNCVCLGRQKVVLYFLEKVHIYQHLFGDGGLGALGKIVAEVLDVRVGDFHFCKRQFIVVFAFLAEFQLVQIRGVGNPCDGIEPDESAVFLAKSFDKIWCVVAGKYFERH